VVSLKIVSSLAMETNKNSYKITLFWETVTLGGGEPAQ
jgi:hypothetical protein